MKENFAKAFEFTMKWEGGKFTDIPGDRGGATKMGVTLGLMKNLARMDGMASELDLDRDGDVDVNDLALIRREVVEKIFRKVAWDAVKADSLPGGIDLLAADLAFNSGVGKYRQFVKEGKTGNITVMVGRREQFFRALAKQPGQAKFLDGWINRNNDSKIVANTCITA